VVHDDVRLFEFDLLRRYAFWPLGSRFPAEFQTYGFDLGGFGHAQVKCASKHRSTPVGCISVLEALQKEDGLSERDTNVDSIARSKRFVFLQ
jgi:hypothetical protein